MYIILNPVEAYGIHCRAKEGKLDTKQEAGFDCEE